MKTFGFLSSFLSSSLLQLEVHSEIPHKRLPLRLGSGTPSPVLGGGTAGALSGCMFVFCPLPTFFSTWLPCSHSSFPQPDLGPVSASFPHPRPERSWDRVVG